MDQKQLRTVGGIVDTALARWTRARALVAAVAYHGTRTDVIGRTASVYDVLGTARKFETYLRDGKVNGND
jgi:hypothetical protein